MGAQNILPQKTQQLTLTSETTMTERVTPRTKGMVFTIIKPLRPRHGKEWKVPKNREEIWSAFCPEPDDESADGHW